MGKPKHIGKKITLGILIFLACLIIAYIGVSYYFTNHFYYGTTINCMNASLKTVDEVAYDLSSKYEDYTLTLEERNGVNENIKAKNIGLKYNSYKEVEKLKNDQNPLKWIYGFFNKMEYNPSIDISYDKNLLEKTIDKLSCVSSNNIVSPKNASLKYTNNNYEILKETLGNEINKTVLLNNISKAILNGENTINLESIKCYENPKYTSQSKELVEAKNTLNKYVSSVITYNLGERNETLDRTIINTWLNIDDNFKISIDKKKIESYVNKLGDNYDVFGKTIDFVTSSGKTIKLRDEHFTRLVNRPAEVDYLLNAITKGEPIQKEPLCIENSGFNEIGNTYVEIDLTKQYIWFYKNGTLMTKGDVVTGDVSSNHSTPEGVYPLAYKQKNAVLRGPGYAAPVSFWMPFNEDIGIHDATWRASFGGNIYKRDGSHGCVNAPYSIAETIFNNIEAGTAVICHS